MVVLVLRVLLLMITVAARALAAVVVANGSIAHGFLPSCSISSNICNFLDHASNTVGRHRWNTHRHTSKAAE